MAWPTDDIATTLLDQGTDSPASARPQILALATKIKAILACFPPGGVLFGTHNDGSGSGLDADLLDGYHATAFVRTVSGQTPDGAGNVLAVRTINSASPDSAGNIVLSGIPSGAVLYFPASSPPSGFIKANGALLRRTTYAALWAYAQASGNIAASDGAWVAGKFSPGDGSTTFRIPDLRSEFLRGWDDGRGIDAGRGIGTAQSGAIESHQHLIDDPTNAYGSGTSIYNANYSRTINQTGRYSGATGGAETRPRNVALLACIKY